MLFELKFLFSKVSYKALDDCIFNPKDYKILIHKI